MKPCTKALLLVSVCFHLFVLSSAQSPIWNTGSFAFSRDTSSLVSMNDASPVNFTGSYGNTALMDFPSGFQFRSGLTNYSKFAISSYGYIKLGGAIFAVNPTLQDSIISALYCFNNTYTCSYKLVGAAPNRTLVIEWAGNYNFVGVIKYQLWLNERIGRIQFLYETGLKSYAYGNGYAIYCKTKIFNQSVVASLKSKPQKQMPTVNYSAIESNNYDSIGAKTRYVFQPDTIKPIQSGNLLFNNVLPGCVDVVVKDSSVNESVFRLERKDGNIYNLASQFITTSPATTGTLYTFNNTRLQPDSDYIYRAFSSNGFLNSDTVIQLLHTPMPLLVGTRKIPGDYPSVNALLQDAACKHIGPELVIELQSSYDISAEGSPIYFYPFLQTKILKHITLRPASGVNLSLSASFANPLILVDSVRNVEIDGRADGSGQTNNLTLRQLNNQWPVISYIRYADSGIVRYCNVEGNLQNGSFGLIYLGSYNPPYYTYLARGVNGTIISNCKIGPQSGFMWKGIVVEAPEQSESITIRDNELLRFYNEAIEFRRGGKNSRVVNNRLYQPNRVDFIANTQQAQAAMLFTEVKDNFRVDSNKIGGTSPVWGIGNWYQSNFSPTSSYSFISLTTDFWNGAAAYITGNEMANVSVAGFNYPLKEIAVAYGNVTIEGNHIGSADSVNSITNDGSHYVIAVSGAGNKFVKNNFISGVQTNYPALTGNRMLVLLIGGGDSLVVTGNDFGGSDNYYANRTDGIARGIDLMGMSRVVIKNNVIRGISSKANGVWGLSEEWEGVSPTAKNMVFDSNSVHHLEGRLTVFGVYANLESTKSSSFSGNYIYALRGIGPANSPGANLPASMLGISVNETTFPGALDTSTVTISNNYIHSLDYVTPQNYYIYNMTGIAASVRRLRMYNNMIALGVGKNGQPTDSTELEPTGLAFNAIVKAEVEHNSVYIGGRGSYAVGMNVPVSLSSNKNVFLSNNIIEIDRYKASNSMEYAYMAGGSSTGGGYNNIVSNYNIWYSKKDTAVNTKLKDWKALCNCDSASFIADPLFINATGDSATQNLHVLSGSPADGAGTPSFGQIVYDVDNDLRASFSPVDIGADAVSACAVNGSLQLPVQKDTLSGCNGGLTLTATVSGIVTSLQWQLNLQDIAGATSGSYTIRQPGWYRITGKTSCGKVASKPVYVTLSSSGTQVDIVQKDTTICLGSSVTLTATGASNYSWSGPGVSSGSNSVTIQPAASGDYIYQVTGTGNGCTSTDQVKITVAEPPVITVNPADTSICNGSTVVLNASGANTYTWSPATGLNTTTGAQVSAQPSATTSYMVAGKNANGCSGTITGVVTVIPSVVPTVTISSSGCSSGTIMYTASATNGGSAPQYQWYVGNNAAGNGSSITVNNVANGSTVTVNFISSAVCANPKTVTATDTVKCVVTAVPDIEGVTSFSVSPNPAADYIVVKMKLTRTQIVTFTLEDMNGRRVYESGAARVNSTYSKTINLSRLTQGCYYLTAVIGTKRIVEKIVVTR